METRGPWSRAQVDAFLSRTRVPLRLAVNGASGHPVLASLWFAALEGRIWCATHRSARIVSLLARDPRCAFEVAPDTIPYTGVRGRATAALIEDRGEEILRVLIERFLGDATSPLARWLLGRAGNEVAIALTPRRVVSWDFTERMGGARKAVP